MKTYWFTFGQSHEHIKGGLVFNKDMVVELRAKNLDEAKQAMYVIFGNEWSMSYTEKPDMSFFKNGCLKLEWKKYINNKLKNAGKA